MKGTIAITGARGFIGRTLCRMLSNYDCHLIGTTRSETPPDMGIEWRRADVTNAANIIDALKDADYIFHLAGIGLTDGDADTVWEVNATGTDNVLKAARSANCERVVFSSTAGTRHRSGKELATEKDIADSVGAYQDSKLKAEKLVQEYVEDGYDAVVVHPTSVFGPGDPRLTPKLIGLVQSKIPVYFPGGGSIVSVRDVADGLILAAEDGSSGEHYILGGENLTFNEILSVIADQAGEWAPPIRIPATAMHLAGFPVGIVNRALGTRFFPVNTSMAKLSTRYRFYDSSKAINELNYSITPFVNHVGEAIDWYKEKQT